MIIMDYNKSTYIERQAVNLTNQSVSGLSLTPTYPSSSVSSSTNVISANVISTYVMSSSPSPTTLCVNCDNSKLLLILS